MKTVIMAGGLGKRASCIANDIPKPLIPIADKPILQWEIECLVRQGFTDIILTVSYMAEKIKDFFDDGSDFGCHISYFLEEQPLGNAGALFKLWEAGKLDGDFLLLNADSMFDVDFKRFIRFHQEHNGLATLFTHPNNHPYDSGLIISSEAGVVKQWLTKEDIRPQWYKNSVNAGLHILNIELLECSGINPMNIDADHKVDLDRDILKPLVSTGRIFAYDSPEYVKDMGTSERFRQVSVDLRNGSVSRRNLSKPQKAIFLDRDGTINRYIGFLCDIDDFELIEDAACAIRLINDSGYLVIVCTNQPVIARGEVTVEQLKTIHNKMETLLGKEGAYLDKIYYCPHHPDKGFEGEIKSLKFDCDCRKPKTGMLLQAANDFNIEMEHSWMIGDGERDIRAGKNAGCKTVLIRSVDGESNSGDMDFGQDVTVKSLKEAVEMILGVNIDLGAC
ncbi:HAD-IIIA family hydrolase [Lachnospiraceae bacterium]|nr:HAD-IIIA family hydrolase [Lachnospiraceae bacterium]